MALDQVRQASKVLGPLLRRRGTSPEVGAALRRALQALDKSLTGLLPQAQDQTISAGIGELRACIELCERSERPSDHEQLEGLRKVLALLAPAETAEVPPPPPLPLPEPSDRLHPRRARRPKAPALGHQTAGLLLTGLGARLQSLHVVSSGSLYRLSDRHDAQAELDKHLMVLGWQGRDRIPELLRAAEARDLDARLLAAAALIHLGEARGAEMMMGALSKASAEGRSLPEISPTLLRAVADARLLDWLLELFSRPASPVIAGLLLPVLAERKLLPAERLWELANHAKDEVAVAAAQALPESDGEPDLPRLLAWADLARTPRRANALLFAAAVLGSCSAVAKVRARLQGGNVDRLLVDALAVAGNPNDAAALLALARTVPDADYLVLAAASLGCGAILPTLAALGDDVPARIVEEARRMLTGGDDGPLDPGLRSLRGRPWSVAGALATLAEPGETLAAQRWLALELGARTGQALPSTLPVLLPAEARPELLARWQAYYARANGRLPPGRWYFQGKAASA